MPVLEDIKVWLDVTINRVEPGSLIHNAIGYGQNQWPELIIYCEDGLTVEKLKALLPWNVKASGVLSSNASHTPVA